MTFDKIRILQTFSGDRRRFRSAIVNAFLAEEPGTGVGKNATRYIYEVETSPSGHVIELHRPAYRNNGIDFTVRVPSIRFNQSRNPWPCVPRHGDLVSTLLSIKERAPKQYSYIKSDLIRAYRCQPALHLDVLAKLSGFPVADDRLGCPADVAVLVAKWLFAEQDLTYWNNSGRAMLFGKLRDNELV